MTLVEMPKANENLTEATIDRWLVEVGEEVTENQSLCDIITDKAKFEMPSPTNGIVLKLCASERSVLPVNYVICVIGSPGELLPTDIEQKNEALIAAHKGMVTNSASPTAEIAATGGGPTGIRATPAARRIAKELNVELAAVEKAFQLVGPISERDVRAFAKGENRDQE